MASGTPEQGEEEHYLVQLNPGDFHSTGMSLQHSVAHLSSSQRRLLPLAQVGCTNTYQVCLLWGNNRTQLLAAFHSPTNLSVPAWENAEDENKVSFLWACRKSATQQLGLEVR